MRPSKETSAGTADVQEGGALGRLGREGEGIKDPQPEGHPVRPWPRAGERDS